MNTRNTNDNITINPIKKLFQTRGLILQIDFTTCQSPNQIGVSANSRLPITSVFENISDPVNSPILQNFNQIEKQWCITQFSQNNTTGFIQFNTGFYWFVTVNNLNKPLRHLKYMSNENESTRYAVGPKFKPESDNDKPKPTPPIPPSEDNNKPNNNNENNRPNDNNNNNNTPTPTTTSNTPTTTILSTSTTSIPTTRTESTTTTFTFPDIPSYTTIDDIFTTTTPTTTTTTTTIPSKTTTNTNTKTTNSPKPIDPPKTTIPPIPPKPTPENYISYSICKEESKETSNLLNEENANLKNEIEELKRQIMSSRLIA
ncbi:hypothetical protein F8M41_011068 [Gigaspora margarita]|uniref:Uncharacterized protein n=1 Tax=Gigaspora margarita TaxID=4874 RepID=A0A8H3X1I5_GIGMA|nr:hypothetical protein F8M41_011068 [Gigaspora margarita]